MPLAGPTAWPRCRRATRTGGGFSLRWIVCHLIEEYARHNGHADLLRESIDGERGDSSLVQPGSASPSPRPGQGHLVKVEQDVEDGGYGRAVLVAPPRGS